MSVSSSEENEREVVVVPEEEDEGARGSGVRRQVRFAEDTGVEYPEFSINYLNKFENGVDFSDAVTSYNQCSHLSCGSTCNLYKHGQSFTPQIRMQFEQLESSLEAMSKGSGESSSGFVPYRPDVPGAHWTHTGVDRGREVLCGQDEQAARAFVLGTFSEGQLYGIYTRVGGEYVRYSLSVIGPMLLTIAAAIDCVFAGEPQYDARSSSTAQAIANVYEAALSALMWPSVEQVVVDRLRIAAEQDAVLEIVRSMPRAPASRQMLSELERAYQHVMDTTMLTSEGFLRCRDTGVQVGVTQHLLLKVCEYMGAPAAFSVEAAGGLYRERYARCSIRAKNAISGMPWGLYTPTSAEKEKYLN